MAEGDPRIRVDPHAPVVGAAMAKSVCHAQCNGAQLVGPRATLELYEARNSAPAFSGLCQFMA